MTEIHLLGTGGYHPTEVRHTACVMIPSAGLVFDAGTAFFRVRPLLQTANLDVFLSHAHLDHSYGLTFLIDVLWEKNVDRVRIHGWSPHLEAARSGLFDSPVFPVPFTYETCPVGLTETVGDWSIDWRTQEHPGSSLGYRVTSAAGSFAYITDTTADPTDAEAVEFIRGVDVLIHECYFSDGYADLARKTGHSWSSAVATFAANAEVGRLILVHVNPVAEPDEIDQMVATAARIFPHVELGTDQMVFRL